LVLVRKLSLPTNRNTKKAYNKGVDSAPKYEIWDHKTFPSIVGEAVSNIMQNAQYPADSISLESSAAPLTLLFCQAIYATKNETPDETRKSIEINVNL
jgi:hypothetical protein